MRETIGPGAVHTLEDLIKKRDSQKPMPEMLEGLSEARNIMQGYQLVQVLGLTGLDSVLLHAFIAERVIRTRLYDLEWIIHSPEFKSTPKQAAKDYLRGGNLQASLNRLVFERSDIAEGSYRDTKNKLRVRNLELAANDLIARGSVYIEDGKHDPYTEIKISDVFLSSWALRWKNKFASKHGHAKQKHLRYKK